MKPWPQAHPDTIANIKHARRSVAMARYRSKILRCERLLIAARYLIVGMHSECNNKLIREIDEEISHK